MIILIVALLKVVIMKPSLKFYWGIYMYTEYSTTIFIEAIKMIPLHTVCSKTVRGIRPSGLISYKVMLS